MAQAQGRPAGHGRASFYAELPARDIADIFRLVNERCGFLSALTPLQPRYAKKIADEDSLMAVIMAQAMNHGNLSMAETSDIPYHCSGGHPSTIPAAGDAAGGQRPDQQRHRAARHLPALLVRPGSPLRHRRRTEIRVGDPTVKARHSRKYFGRGKGIVAYTLLANHVPLADRTDRRPRARKLLRVRHLLQQHFGYRADRPLPATCTASTKPISPSCTGSA